MQPNRTRERNRIRIGARAAQEEGAGAGAERQAPQDDPSRRVDANDFRRRAIQIVTARTGIGRDPAIQNINMRSLLRSSANYLRYYEGRIDEGFSIARRERQSSIGREREGRCEQCVRFRDRSIPRYDLDEYFSFLFGQRTAINDMRIDMANIAEDLRVMPPDTTVGGYYYIMFGDGDGDEEEEDEEDEEDEELRQSLQNSLEGMGRGAGAA